MVLCILVCENEQKHKSGEILDRFEHTLKVIIARKSLDFQAKAAHTHSQPNSLINSLMIIDYDWLCDQSPLIWTCTIARAHVAFSTIFFVQHLRHILLDHHTCRFFLGFRYFFVMKWIPILIMDTRKRFDINSEYRIESFGKKETKIIEIRTHN